MSQALRLPPTQEESAKSSGAGMSSGKKTGESRESLPPPRRIRTERKKGAKIKEGSDGVSEVIPKITYVVYENSHFIIPKSSMEHQKKTFASLSLLDIL